MKSVARRAGFGPSAWLLSAAVFMGAGTATAALADAPAAGALPILRHSADLGPVAQTSPMEVTFWLRLRNAAHLDDALAAQRQGAAYLTGAQIDTQLAPAASDVEAVRSYLTAQGFQVTGVGPHNLYVRARGTTGLVQSALHVQMHQYRLNEITFRASARDATLPAQIAPLVAAVGGISSLGAMPNVAQRVQGIGTQPNLARQSDGEGLRPNPVLLGKASPGGLIFSAQCFTGLNSVSFSGAGASATYQGNGYGQNINNTAAGTVAPCGYQPSDVQTAYGLTPLYQSGLNGRGETIAIIDAYGSTTIQQDIAAFSQYMGLPAADLTVIGTPTESNYSTDTNATWATETTLDVEWVHAVAPGAKIVLVIAPTNSTDDLFSAILTASSLPGVVSISNSWSSLEASLYPAYQQSADTLLKLVGVKGASLQFATGDSGDNAIDVGFYDVGWPASSPNATAVGGVSLGLAPNKRIAFQSAWGNTITEVADTAALGSPPIDPPNNEGFLYGGGGGTSDIYPLPFFQRGIGIGGGRRQIPDISWLADPYTGVEVIYTADAQGDLGIEVVGGTSLATPMFSALWGIATQAAGHPLGLAAPYLYGLPPGAITDIVPVNSPSNVTGTITDSSGASAYGAGYLALPLQGQPGFYSALYNSPFSTRWFVLSFGLDSTLRAGIGWDPATGLGVPNPWFFVQAFRR